MENLEREEIAKTASVYWGQIPTTMKRTGHYWGIYLKKANYGDVSITVSWFGRK
ncbi:MAG: hypothetical protein ACO1QS_09850 [Verrucomicrobiota bacterium]